MRQLFDSAIQLQQLGDFPRAEALYRQILHQSPQQPDALNALGMLLHQAGRDDEALTVMRLAVAADKQSAHTHLNLGELLRVSGQLDEAEVSIRRALKRKPNYPEAQFCLGKLLHDRGEREEAVKLYCRVLNAKPHLVDAYKRLGLALHELWQLDEAISSFSYALKLEPDDVETHLSLADVYFDKRDMTLAETHYRQCLRLNPNSAHANRQLAIILGSMAHINPDEIDAFVQQAYLLEPEATETLYIKGLWHLRQGDNSEGLALLQRSLAQKPIPDALYQYALNKKFSVADEVVVQSAKRLLEDSPNNDEVAVMAEFALAKMYEDLKDYRLAFGHYQQGNIHARKVLPHDEQAEEAQFARIQEYFSPQIFEQFRLDIPESEKLIFIVGMPRSGTTLTEQIIASHPSVFGAGELIGVAGIESRLSSYYGKGQSYPDVLGQLTAATLKQVALAYLSETQRIFPGNHTHIADKMPHNFLRLGTIALLLPKAHIIHVQRDAMDNCLSLYFQHFSSRWHTYANDLRDIGLHYLRYQKLMQHWKATLPIPILDVPYERLVADPEHWSRKIVDFCGLPWDDQCLNPNQTQRVVRTSNTLQVRQPIYQTSVAKWKRYEEFLTPLKEVLQSQG